jgi:hypothetical protein
MTLLMLQTAAGVVEPTISRNANGMGIINPVNPGAAFICGFVSLWKICYVTQTPKMKTIWTESGRRLRFNPIEAFVDGDTDNVDVDDGKR